MTDPTETFKAGATAVYTFHGRETLDTLRDHVGQSCVILDDLTDTYESKRLVMFADGYTAIAFEDELTPKGKT